jgi:hypothetical protein
MLTPGEAGIRYRGREIKPAELPEAIVQLEADIAAVEKRLADGDRLCRSTHMAAATELGHGWAAYLQGLIAVLHYADHSRSNIHDLHGVLAHTVHVATVTHRVSHSGRKRIVAAAKELHAALSQLNTPRASVILDSTLLARLGTTAWTEMLSNLELGPPDRETIGDWLGVIDGWAGAAIAACSALRAAALDQLLVAEGEIAEHVRRGTIPGDAPAPSVVPATYDTLLNGKERERKSTLNLWERFQVADGAGPAAARLVAAAAIVLAVLGFGGTVGAATVTIYNGLAVPISVAIDGKSVAVAPHEWSTRRLSDIEDHRIETRTESGTLIETFAPHIAEGSAQFVYNVAGATPMVEWTAVYGSMERPPARYLGAPRWSRTTAQVVFDDPPESISTSGEGGTRRVLTGMADFSPVQQLSVLTDSVDRRRVIETHARWDATDSRGILHWFRYARYVDLDMKAMLPSRLAESPNDVVLLALEQDMASGPAKDSVCLRHRARAEAAPDNPALYYVGARCLGEGAAATQAFLEGRARWPQDGWLAFAAGHIHAEAGRWEDALAALMQSHEKVLPLASSVGIDAARVSRMIARDTMDLFEPRQASVDPVILEVLERGASDDSVTRRAFAALARGGLRSALEIARADTVLDARMVRLVAASDGATPDMQARAFALDDTAGIRDDTRWAAIALALRAKKDHTPFLPPEDFVPPQKVQRMMTFLDLARGPNPASAERALDGLPPELRGHAYSMALVLLGERAPQSWRDAASKLLFGAERPFFRKN